MNAFDVAKKFLIDSHPVSCEEYGCGHINDTYLVVTEKNTKYILQRINTRIFKNPVGLMNNIKLVTEYLKSNGAGNRETLSLIYTVENGFYYVDDENYYYRMYDFVTDTVTYQAVENNRQFEQCAEAFGRFQKQLSGFDASELVEVIPNFHNTFSRFNDFKKSLELDSLGRAKDVEVEIKFVLEREADTKVLVDLLNKGDLKLRVTHNDTKLNNILFDKNSDSPICVIDLDTIMPGLALYDFGDSIRFGASTGAEDEKDLSKIECSLELFDCYTKGFLSECGDILDEKEKLLLPFGAKIMTLECGIRFLADYLDGDVYFKTHYPEHNLDRCRTQFKLVSDMESKMDDLINIIKKYL